MIDLTKIKYRTTVVTESGKQYNIKDYIENLGWEENENELAVRISFTARNDKTSKGYLSSIIKPGCLVGIFASDGGRLNQEVARGYVNTWNTVLKNSDTVLKCTGYDELYNLQKSQDNIFIPSGTGTKSAITGVLDAHGVPLGEYNGPDVSHGQLMYNNKDLSYIILDLLDDAKKKSSGKYIIRGTKGKVDIVPRGGNKTIYVFQVNNTVSVSESMSIADLVTRVKVLGQANDEGNSSVDAVLNGLTQYGVRQRIYTRGADEDLESAKTAAQEILNESGNIVKEISVQGPDVPVIRKGDLIYLIAGTSRDYFYVKGVRHDADSCSMTMDLEEAKQETVSENKTEEAKGHNVGDVVNFHGGTHYVSSYPGSAGYGAGAGKAKITIKDGSGGAHPWHLVHEDSASNVYGWVDDGTFD